MSGERTSLNSSGCTWPVLDAMAPPSRSSRPPSRNKLVRLREDRHHGRGAAADHAAWIGRKFGSLGDDAHADAELAHRLDGLRPLAPGRQDEAPGLGVVPREELTELADCGDVVAGALAQPLVRLLEVAQLDVPDHAGHRISGPLPRDRVTGELRVVAAGHRDHALIDVPAPELDHDRHTLADPLPALLGRLVVPQIDLGAQRRALPRPLSELGL